MAVTSVLPTTIRMSLARCQASGATARPRLRESRPHASLASPPVGRDYGIADGRAEDVLAVDDLNYGEQGEQVDERAHGLPGWERVEALPADDPAAWLICG
jgi:hypothetical protein